MNDLSPRWRIFRLICIIQMVLVSFRLMFSVSGVFFRRNIMLPLSETIVYGLIFLFVYMGLALLNDYFPDTPLADKQRRRFNWLFLLNVLFIAYLFGQLITEYRTVSPWFEVMVELSFFKNLEFLASALLALAIFCLHVIFLSGMFQLRRVIYRNTVNQWYQQFGEEKNK